VFGGRGSDQLELDGPGSLAGGPGDDILIGHGHWYLRSGVSYAAAKRPVKVDLSTGIATGEGTDTLISVDSILGSPYGDTIIGDDSPNGPSGGDGDDDIRAGAGYEPDTPYWADHDRIIGGLGNDEIYGEGHHDEIYPGPGDDFVDGGLERDEINYRGSLNAIWASLIEERAEGDGIDTLIGIEQLSGSSLNDTLIGDAGSNSLNGWGGKDLVYGRRGADFLQDIDGEHGDELYGNWGKDSLHSKPWSTTPTDDDVDLLNGGKHGDVCVPSPSDTRVNCELSTLG
jgi:Ca2+-binding RTX toxin-like protein